MASLSERYKEALEKLKQELELEETKAKTLMWKQKGKIKHKKPKRLKRGAKRVKST